MRRHIIAMALMASTATALAQTPTPAPPPSPSPTEIVAAAPLSEWVAIPASDLLIMTLAPDAQGRERRAIIQLMPAPFSEGWVANIRTLARAHWWDGLAVVRVQDNYVAQWGDPDSEDAATARALPPGLRVMTEQDYTVDQIGIQLAVFGEERTPEAVRELREAINAAPRRPAINDDSPAIRATRTHRARAGWHDRDSVAEWVEFYDGWPFAAQGELADTNFWPIHCYGMVGVGRNLSPDTGTGAELYTVIGHAPRHLDRNIALVGRVIEGMQHLSSLPRGTGPLGFYETLQERTTITSIRLASDLPAAEQPRLQYLSTDSASFGLYAAARANRRDPFFIRPAGGADICNIPVPVRRVPQ
jgi:cyclophilin family peptidyl-prolyl cis-trans isomerase